MGGDAVLTMADVSFTYRGGRQALRDVNLHVRPGETVFVLGASGSGKSTLCLTANGLIPHFVKGELSGCVAVRGKDTREHAVKALAPEVGVVFQDFESQLFSTTAELEVAFGPENLALPREEIRRRVTAALSRAGLAGYEQRFPGSLSGGEKQRLAVASALALEPSVLVFDEATSDLDPKGKEDVHAVARALGEERRVALLIAEPEAPEASDADRLVVLREGAVALSGRPEEVLRRVPELLAAGIRPPPAAEVTARLGLPVAVENREAAEVIRNAGFRCQSEAAAPNRADSWPTALEARRASFSYPGRPPALRAVDLRVAQGDFVAVLGRNGSGKTTLAKLLAGIVKPTGGCLDRGEQGRGVGFVFQNPDHQIFSETVAAEVAFGPQLQGLAPKEVAARVEEALAAVALADRGASDPFLLSKGERQRVAVASVLATRPDVLILDEPTTGLDYREVREMMGLVSRLHAGGHTVVIVTHAMWVAAEYARRVLVMEQGEVIAHGPPQEIFFRADVLERAALKPPAAVRLAAELGIRALTPDEIVASLAQG